MKFALTILLILLPTFVFGQAAYDTKIFKRNAANSAWIENIIGIPANGYILSWNDTTKSWEATAPGGFTTSAELAALLSDETGTGSAVFGTNPTLESPAIIAGFYDTLGNEQLMFSSFGSAVNYLRIDNSATGIAVRLRPQGGDANISTLIENKGLGILRTTGGLEIDDGANDVRLALSGDRLFHDTNNNGAKDVGEEFIDEVGGGGSFDPTAIDSVTWSDGANASNLWTFDVSGTNPTINFASNAVTVAANFSATNLSGPGEGISFDASGYSGNLTPADNTLGELADVVDALAITGFANPATENLDMNGFDILGIDTIDITNLSSDTLLFAEKAAGGTIADGFGEIFVKNDATTTVWFKDDANVEHQLGVGGASEPTQVDIGAGTNIDWDAGDVFVADTLGATFTPTFTNLPGAGETALIQVILTGGGATVVDWSTPTITWQGEEPVQTVDGTDVYTFVHADGITYGAHLPANGIAGGEGKAYGSIYFSVPAATANEIATPIKVAGTTAAQNTTNNVTLGTDNTLTYTGANTKDFIVAATFDVAAASATDSIFYLYKNGSPIQGAEIDRVIANNDAGAMAIMGQVTLSTDDYVELWCETDDGADLTVGGIISLTQINEPQVLAASTLYAETIAADKTAAIAEVQPGFFVATAASTLTLPPGAIGRQVTFKARGDVTILLEPDAADQLVLNGTLLDAGDRAQSTGTGEEMIVATWDGAYWDCVTDTVWTDVGL